MKVLMFGWEFPPHISGGLGTACFGLTQSLVRQKVKVLFVVPRLHGDETVSDPTLINASEVKRSRKGKTADFRASPQPAIAVEEVFHSTLFGGTHEGMAYIEVPAGISPYGVSQNEVTGRFTEKLTRWNYSVSSSGDISLELRNEKNTTSHIEDEPHEEGESYRFTGTYGPRLFEEVRRYGEVGAIIAGQHSFDVIHVHDWMTFTAGILAKQATGKPLVVHVHSTEVDRAGEHINKEIFELEKRGFMEADRLVTVSNWTKRIVVSRYKIPPEKITVVHNGILPKEHTPGIEFPEIGSHFITFLGRVTHQKGPVFFVEAARRVLEEFPDAHFIVAGAGDLLPQIIERVAQLNMSANFHFTGFLSGHEVDQVWSMTDVYVMPSVSEPFGIAPLEAIQGGVPVILSNQSGVSEVMPHAIKVDFWDTNALAGAICSVLRYESLSQVLRQHGKKHIEHLTWDKAASDVKSIYHELRRKQQ